MWSSVIKWVSIAATVAIVAYMAFSLKKSIETAAIAEQVRAQQAQTIIELQNQIAQNAKIANDSIKIIEELNTKNLQLSKTLNKLEEYLNSEQGNKDSEHVCVDSNGNKTITRESSPVLKHTVKELIRQSQ